MQAPYSNSIAGLFGTRLPIVAGGLMWLARAPYVAAAARAGIMGFITAATFSDLDELRSEIRHCRDLCEGRPFGVNVSMLPKLIAGERTQEVFELLLQEGVGFVETSGRNPAAFMPYLQGTEVKVLHKVATVQHAIKAASQGVDAVSIVGAECGGHPGMDMVGTFVNAAWMERHMRIPYLVGGGVGHGSQIVAALAMGASGVVMGTRFLVADEIWAHDRYKARLVEAAPTDTTICMQAVRNPVRCLNNETARQVQALERETPALTIQDLLPLVAGSIGRKAYETGHWETGILSAGQALAFVEKTASMGDIVAQLEDEMRQSFARLPCGAPCG